MTEEVNGVTEVDGLDTPELVVPPPEQDAHRGRINGVEVENYDTGSSAIVISLQSIDAGFEEKMKIFPPKSFVEDVNVDPNTLDDVPAAGKKQSERQRYAQVVSNSDKNAELQRLRSIATGQGRRYSGPRPSTFAEYVAALNSVLLGCSVVFTRQPDTKAEGTFKNRLRVNGVYDESTIINDPKALKKYRKAWQ